MEIELNTSCEDQWYVVQCKTGKEKYAVQILRDLLGLTIYLPEHSISSRNGKREHFPFFPGYFFVHVNLEQINLSRINSSPGVLKLLDFGYGPHAVPQSLISVIKAMVNRSNVDTNPSHHNLSTGDVVRVKNGPLQGLEATFVQALTSNERAQILLHFLGRLSKTQVNIDQLEKIQDSPATRTERRTRGKGRKISQIAHLDSAL